MLDFFLVSLILLISVLISVGFFTLFERKILGYINNRKGPNKVGILGVMQPFADGAKLFLKENLIPLLAINFPYFISPMSILFISLLMWNIIPMSFHSVDHKLGLLLFLSLTGLSVYSLIFSGWSSNSKYAILGAYRGVAQAISYEVSLSLILLCFVELNMSYDLESYSIIFLMVMPMMGVVWFVSSLAETNRSPFDFAESESELVSGFNIEYSSFLFAFIFIGEYSSILFMSYLFSIGFLGGPFLIEMKTLMMIFFFILIRGTLPRFRYDHLMYLAWKVYLPFSLNFLIFYISLYTFVISNMMFW
uniref:NADH-ubiquinone oxidoreductase chain 1 n=1 Tax=Nymphon unguiculatum-charcoti complex sp. SEM-1997 TaxID=61899 RepID=E0XLH8_9CHEL|nr:NADH dehydrogenase subunit 1 [Nymphon unguiculatum-charcoti complex sp. SEM-1997]